MEPGRRVFTPTSVKTRLLFATLAATAATQDVSGLNPPSDSDGPIKLLSCVVSASGVLEAEVDSKSDDAMNCNIQCSYEFGGKPFSHWFNVNIPKRYVGRVGRFDTNGGRTGTFSGEVGTCRKTDVRGTTE
jgi:hypothetical protein